MYTKIKKKSAVNPQPAITIIKYYESATVALVIWHAKIYFFCPVLYPHVYLLCLPFFSALPTKRQDIQEKY
jgi:hypothetical protein